MPSVYRGGTWVERKPRKKEYVPQPVKNAISAAINRFGELKRLPLINNQTGGNVALLAAANSSVLLTNITGGSTIGTRVGNKCALKKLELRMAINWDNIASLGRFRFIIFEDKQPVIGTPATYGDVFAAQTSPGNDPYAFQAIANTKRFRVIYDKFLKPDPMTTADPAGQGSLVKKITKKWKKGGYLLSYTNATDTNVQGHHLYYIFGTDIAANLPTIRLEGQLHFKDPQ